jgi:hypothetical protein
VVFSHVPFAYRKKSSPGATALSIPSRSIPGADAADETVAGVVDVVDAGPHASTAARAREENAAARRVDFIPAR